MSEFVTESKLSLLAIGQANKSGDQVLRLGKGLHLESWDKRRWQTRVLKYQLIGFWMLVSFIGQRGGGSKKVK